MLMHALLPLSQKNILVHYKFITPHCVHILSTITLFRRYEVTFSMLEIYNEQVRDLLQKESPKGGLPVRQNPKLGLFYVQGLKFVPVGSYAEIEKRIEQGMSIRLLNI